MTKVNQPETAMNRIATLCGAALALGLLGPGKAQANSFTPVKDLDTFLSLVQDRELRLGAFGIALKVMPDGTIAGRAGGWDVAGSWNWQDGYFCREMDWSGTPIPYNCQLVEVAGSDRIRFTVDRGAGDSAAFNLR
jgi:hypothetical protein